MEIEFLENLKSIHLLNCSLNYGEKCLVLTSKVDEANFSCVFKIFEKEKIWVKTFSYQQFENHKQKMGFDGVWKAFFNTLALALRDGGVSLKYQKNPQEVLIIAIYHPISEELKVKSEIIFEEFHLTSSEEYKNLNYELVLELYQSKELELQKERKKLSNLSSGGKEPKRIEADQKEGRISAKLDVKKSLKRKFNSNLINPNVKRRKQKGVQFVRDVSSGEEN